MLGDIDPATAEPSVDFPGPGNDRAAFADVFPDTAFEIADRARVFAVLQGVLIAFRCAAARNRLRRNGVRSGGPVGGARKI
jgi:hypothetical protein